MLIVVVFRHHFFSDKNTVTEDESDISSYISTRSYHLSKLPPTSSNSSGFKVDTSDKCSTEAGTYGGLTSYKSRDVWWLYTYTKEFGGEFGYGSGLQKRRVSLNSASGQRFCMATAYKERLRSLQKAVPSRIYAGCCTAHTWKNTHGEWNIKDIHTMDGVLSTWHKRRGRYRMGEVVFPRMLVSTRTI